MATGPGSNSNDNKLGVNRPTSNAPALRLSVGGVAKILGAFFLAGAGVVGVEFLG